MTNFVVGQRVQRIDNTYHNMQVNDTDCIISISDFGSLTLEKYGPGHCAQSFVTIIRDINDVIPGMTVTIVNVAPPRGSMLYKEDGSWGVARQSMKGKSVKVKSIAKCTRNAVTLEQNRSAETYGFFWTLDCFQEYQPISAHDSYKNLLQPFKPRYELPEFDRYGCKIPKFEGYQTWLSWYTSMALNKPPRLLFDIPQNKSKEKDMTKTYVIGETFSLLDIAVENPCFTQFLKLCSSLDNARALTQDQDLNNIRWIKGETLTNHVLLNNLSWLMDRDIGNITEIEKKKETPLMRGMKLRVVGKSTTYIVTSNLELINRDTGRYYGDVCKTLEDLNQYAKNVNDSSFEICD